MHMHMCYHCIRAVLFVHVLLLATNISILTHIQSILDIFLDSGYSITASNPNDLHVLLLSQNKETTLS